MKHYTIVTEPKHAYIDACKEFYRLYSTIPEKHKYWRSIPLVYGTDSGTQVRARVLASSEPRSDLGPEVKEDFRMDCSFITNEKALKIGIACEDVAA
jgi:hypothetical protein